MGILWEDQPAGQWLEAYPVGNGRLGAMLFGGYDQEKIQLNLDSLWYGGPMDRINPDARAHLAQVRSLLLKQKPGEAEELLRYTFSGTPQSMRPYQPLGELWLRYEPSFSHVEQYRRELVLKDGLVEEAFCSRRADCSDAEENVRVRKTCFASYPDQALVLHLEAEGGEGLSFSCLLKRGRFYEKAGKRNDRSIFMEGQAGEGGVRFYAALTVVEADGKAETLGEHLILKNCHRVTLALAGETGFYGEDPEKAVENRLAAVEKKTFQKLLSAHQADYHALFDRVKLSLGTKGACEKTPPFHEYFRLHTEDPAVAETYVQFGRYLMIAGSRPGSLPLNLQGIWNEDFQPAWDSKYTININTEMNYWPAEPLNLSECHGPLFDLLERVCENGKETARRMYGCRGSVAHHNTDIWADTAPQDIYIPATYWVMGEAWLCTHIMTHYRSCGDKAFLRRMYHCLEEAVLFFHDFLIEDQGQLVTCPSISPENTYLLPDGTEGRVCTGSTMDTEILRDLFTDYLEASEILGITGEYQKKTVEILGKLPPIQIGRHGQIMEWREDYDEKEPGHRHISQLYGLYPSHQISRERTPELSEAAAATIARRLAHGGGYTGWSCAWIIAMYASLGDGEKAYGAVRKLFEESTADNLMDTHPRKGGVVFQIDGNLGAAAGIAAMLFQWEKGLLKLLPALPEAWEEGSLSGVRIGMGGELDFAWKKGNVISCQVRAGETDLEFTLMANGAGKSVKVPAGSRGRLI